MITARNPVDEIVDLVRRRVTEDDIALSFSDETLKQYVAYHVLNGNAIWCCSEETGEVTGAIIAYECGDDELRTPFNWVAPSGKNCIFVAQLVAIDQDARDTLAKGYLNAFPSEKPTYAMRRGSLVPMNAHRISRKLLKRRESDGK